MNAPMRAERLAEIRRIRGGTYLRECVAEIDRLRTSGDDRTALDLQLSINRALMDRLDALEAKVSELEHRQAV
jgi:hypothetical protein